MSRKDRVNAFLDFVLKNEEYLIPFDDVLNNNEDLLKAIQSLLYELSAKNADWFQLSILWFDFFKTDCLLIKSREENIE